MSARSKCVAALSPWLMAAACLVVLAGCGGGSNGGSGSSTPAPVANTVNVTVDSGPTGTKAINSLYVSVTLCNPGSTTSCATVDHVQIDTSTTGLRLLASAVTTLSPSPITDASKNPVQECIEFANGSYIWGPVVTADVQMAGEKASNLPIQLINSTYPSIPPPSSCTGGGGQNLGSVAGLQANGILGVGTTALDCGVQCTAAPVLPYYWLCPSNVCTTAALPVTSQVTNPVLYFPADNNGVSISLPNISASGQPSASGTMTFGIGTQSDNALKSSVTVYPLGPWLVVGPFLGDYTFQTTYNSVNYPAFIDTGSPFLLLLDATALASTGVVACPTLGGFYCPNSPVNIQVSNAANGSAAGAAVPVMLSVGNAETLRASSVAAGGQNAAFANLVGDSGNSAANDFAELGIPFFYGRTVYFGILGRTPVPSGANVPNGYFAY